MQTLQFASFESLFLSHRRLDNDITVLSGLFMHDDRVIDTAVNDLTASMAGVGRVAATRGEAPDIRMTTNVTM